MSHSVELFEIIKWTRQELYFKEITNDWLAMINIDGTYCYENGGLFPSQQHSLWKFEADGKLYYRHPWGNHEWTYWCQKGNNSSGPYSMALIQQWVLEMVLFNDK